MTEFEKELVRFVSGYLDAGVSAEDYVKAFSQRLLDSIGRQSKEQPVNGGLEWTEKDKSILNNIVAYKYLNVDDLEWLKDIPKRIQQGKPNVCEGLEEEISRYLREDCSDDDEPSISEVARHFAKWQKEKDERTLRKFFNDRNQGDASFYDLLAYREGHRDGMDEQKEQMLKGAVEGKVFMSFAPGHNQMVMADVDLPTNTKVRIIIVKED